MVYAHCPSYTMCGHRAASARAADPPPRCVLNHGQVVQLGGGGIAVEGEEFDDFGIFSASGNVLSQVFGHVGVMVWTFEDGRGQNQVWRIWRIWRFTLHVNTCF